LNLMLTEWAATGGHGTKARLGDTLYRDSGWEHHSRRTII